MILDLGESLKWSAAEIVMKMFMSNPLKESCYCGGFECLVALTLAQQSNKTVGSFEKMLTGEKMMLRLNKDGKFSKIKEALVEWADCEKLIVSQIVPTCDLRDDLATVSSIDDGGKHDGVLLRMVGGYFTLFCDTLMVVLDTKNFWKGSVHGTECCDDFVDASKAISICELPPFVEGGVGSDGGWH